MIVWLASYPKSGNTYLRALLSGYFFSNDGNFDFEDLKNISQFPDPVFFKDLNINLNDFYEVAKNYINSQKILNKGSDTIQFLKTHSSFCKVNDHHFTNVENSLGVIYIVRDPRNVVVSQSHHFGLPISEITNLMTNNKRLIGSNGFQTFLGSWSFNFNSWKKFGEKFLLLKYEDLIKDPETCFLKIIKFLENLSSTKYEIDNKKLKKTIETTKFNRLKELERKSGFSESVIDKETQKKKIFFNLGPGNNYSQRLDTVNRKKIEDAFALEMKELSYL